MHRDWAQWPPCEHGTHGGLPLDSIMQDVGAPTALLRAVLDATGDGVIVCAPDGTITMANPTAEGILRRSPTRSYTGLVATFAEPVRAPRLGRRQGPVELRTQQHPERWIELSTFPVGEPAQADPVSDTIVILRDTTESRRSEAVRETFVGVLSHELRTPITTIYGAAKLLGRDGSTLDDATRRSVFADISDESERLQRLVEDLVALNRFGDATGEVAFEPVLLQRLLPRVIESEQARWPGVTFRLDLDADLPVVLADATYVEQVCRNLLSNAAKYGGTGVTVEVTATTDAEHDVIVTVLDDGPGFPPDDADRLFDLFYRASTAAAIVSGAGIGLFVCALLVSAMRGRIWASARPGGGSAFAIALQILGE